MKQEDVDRRQREQTPPDEFICQVCHEPKKNIHMGKFHWVCDICEAKADEPGDEL